MPAVSIRRSTWPWAAVAALLVVASAAVRICYMARGCPLDLAPDEAHYWDWSRHLDWSYYSKGPLVAYLIRAGCSVAGAWSRKLIANEMLAVRLPAVLCGALLLWSLYLLTVRIYGSRRLGAGVIALALTLPVFGAGSSLMTIDAPFTCCWGWALVVGHEAIFRRARWAWPVLGVLVGVGMLAKYTMVLWLPCAGLFLLFSPTFRRLLWERGFWTAAAVGAACCLPILIWNAEHGWVTFRHMQGHAGLDEPHIVYWHGPLDYLGGQVALFLGYWFFAWLVAMIVHRPGKETDPAINYLWWMSGPVFVFFLLFSVKNGGGEPNWPVVAYESGLILTAAWLGEQLLAPAAWYRRLTIGGLAAACSLGLAVNVFMYHADWAQPLLLRISGAPTPAHPIPLRRFDPTCRLRGWQELARTVDRVRSDLRARGTEPVLAATGWTLPGEIGFYCAGHPTVYSLGLGLGDRHSEYDFWRPNPIADPDRFRGRTFVVVGGCDPALIIGAFEVIERPQIVVYEENGQPIASWPVVVCRGFRGFGGNGASAPTF